MGTQLAIAAVTDAGRVTEARGARAFSGSPSTSIVPWIRTQSSSSNPEIRLLRDKVRYRTCVWHGIYLGEDEAPQEKRSRLKDGPQGQPTDRL